MPPAHRILAAEPTGTPRRLRLTFAPVQIGEVTISDDGTPAGKALDNPGVLAQVKLDETTGGLRWPNGYKLPPEPLYEAAAPAGPDEKGNGATIPALLGTIVSGLGVLGFVTLAGGVVLWSRFNGMGIPADHALGLVPKSELVATGAAFLVPALLFSTAAVVIVVLISSLIDHFTPWPPTRWLLAPVLLGVSEVVFTVKLKDTIPADAVWLLVLVAGLGALAVSSGARMHVAVFALATFLAVGSFAIARTYELTSHDLKVLPMAYSRTQLGEATRVEVGYFVAETSDRILFASLPKAVTAKKKEAPNELREFPRTETDDLEIGELVRPGRAEKVAARFAYNLCERLAHLTPAPPSSGSSITPNGKAVAPAAKASAVCPRRYLKQLAGKAGVPWKPDRAENLEKGLTACHEHKGRHARMLCERRMREAYGPKQSHRTG